MFGLTTSSGDDAVTRHDATREYTSNARDVAIGDNAFADGPAIWVRNGEDTYQFGTVASIGRSRSTLAGAASPSRRHADKIGVYAG